LSFRGEAEESSSKSETLRIPQGDSLAARYENPIFSRIDHIVRHGLSVAAMPFVAKADVAGLLTEIHRKPAPERTKILVDGVCAITTW